MRYILSLVQPVGQGSMAAAGAFGADGGGQGATGPGEHPSRLQHGLRVAMTGETERGHTPCRKLLSFAGPLRPPLK